MRMFLAIAALTTLWFFCGTSAAQPKQTALPKAALGDLSGVGSSEENAKKNALKKAADAVNRMMAEHDPPLKSFVVDEAYVISHQLLRNAGRAGKEVEEKIQDNRVVSKEWIVTFRTDTDWWSEIVRRDQEAERKLRADSRQKVGGLGILGLAGLLLVGFGYVRLDEYTQRRYTTWLRLAGVGLGSMVAAGWWVIFFNGAG